MGSGEPPSDQYTMPARYFAAGDQSDQVSDDIADYNDDNQVNYPGDSRQVSLAALAAYLSALYPALPSSRLTNKLHPAPGWPVALLPELATLPMSQHSGITGGSNKTKGHLVGDSHMVQVAILVATLLVAFLAVKLILRYADRQSLLRRRFESTTISSLWPSKSASKAGVVVGEDVGAKQPAPLEDANINRRLSGGFVDETGKKPLLDDSSSCCQESRMKHLDVLSQKLTKLLSLSSKCELLKSPNKCDTDKCEVDELASQTVDVVVDAADEDDDNESPGRFRSSRSYIKSLINALTKAHSELPSAKSSESCNSATELAEVVDSSGAQESQSDLQGQGIAMSQMNISAAHLILAHMEKQLEDKEQLEREWLELNAGGKALGKAQTCRSPVTATGGSKIDQLVLARLAKVALNEENRAKNRNCLAVPYDRNRVKLNCSPVGASGTTGNNNNNNGAGSRLASSVGDYINASYIHDDDSRRPTHIIAQGPTEQTSGQFWQVSCCPAIE